MDRPESIENRWDILYRDYPEGYEAFSNTPYHPTIFEQISRIIGLGGKSIADVGAGTGSSTLALARFTQRVIGIEREAAMLRLARRLQSSKMGRFFWCGGIIYPKPGGFLVACKRLVKPFARQRTVKC